MNLRSFLKTIGLASVMPPLPPGFRTVPVMSPKGAEQVQSWGRRMSVSVETAIHPMARQPLAATTGMRAAIQISGNNVTISWVGGSAVFQVQYRQLMTDPWVICSEPMMGRSVTLPMFSGNTAFYRVQEQVPLLIGVRDATGTHLTWQVPVLE